MLPGIHVFQWRFDSSTSAVIAPVPFCNCESILNRLHLLEIITPQGAIHLEHHLEIVLLDRFLRHHFPCILLNAPTDLPSDVATIAWAVEPMWDARIDASQYEWLEPMSNELYTTVLQLNEDSPPIIEAYHRIIAES